ncbi:esterase [Lactobacillus alvi]|uniref:Esterase n=1 Tax=Limosilactobacillus alvi TaxID=990412 RepID=A0ABS2EPL3_9LACO|nr:alpha/beta hydrolase-fold protein [Limosilactobacillus alvi]MBM6754315.1 esterase [Limosilactobacillus alvi]
MFARILKMVLTVGGVFGLVVLFNSNHAEAASRTETIRYQTEYQGRQYNKQALVYLPANYTNAKKYNVVYLLHGSTESSQDFFRDGHFKQLLDRLNQNGRLKDTIVVFPTYYPSRKFVTANYYRDNHLNRSFAQNELVNDLIPAVEGRYRTYADGTSKAQLRNSRGHRAFGGFSMGSITTWYVFEYQLPYFSSFLPMAGDSWTIADDGGSTASTRTARRLAKTVQNNANLSFKILAGVGADDGTSGSMTPQINAMHRLPEFNHQNLKYYQAPNGTHSPQTIAQIFNHYANQIFN